MTYIKGSELHGTLTGDFRRYCKMEHSDVVRGSLSLHAARFPSDGSEVTKGRFTHTNDILRENPGEMHGRFLNVGMALPVLVGSCVRANGKATVNINESAVCG